NGRGVALGLLVGDGVAASVDCALQLCGALSRLRRVPSTKRADRETTLLATMGRVRQDESLVASGSDADTEARRPILPPLGRRGVVSDPITLGGRFEAADDRVCEAYRRHWLFPFRVQAVSSPGGGTHVRAYTPRVQARLGKSTLFLRLRPAETRKPCLSKGLLETVVPDRRSAIRARRGPRR